MFFLLVVSGVLCLPAVQAQQGAQSVETIVRWNKQFVGIVIARSARDATVRLGTVFLTNRQGFAITSARVVASSPSSLILLRFPGCPAMPVLSVHYSTGDVAVLRVAADICTFHTPPVEPSNPFPQNRSGFAFAGAKSVQEGQQVLVIGFLRPDDFGSGAATVATGIVRAVREDAMLIQAPIGAGTSGAPVLNMLGEVVGMVGGTSTGDQRGLDFATPANKLQLEFCYALQAEKVLTTSDQFLKCLP